MTNLQISSFLTTTQGNEPLCVVCGITNNTTYYLKNLELKVLCGIITLLLVMSVIARHTLLSLQGEENLYYDYN